MDSYLNQIDVELQLLCILRAIFRVNNVSELIVFVHDVNITSFFRLLSRKSQRVK